ncbi:hypothetical protein CPT_Moonbeam170 [Bacillus phage Moonbeam]|uniref:Uncharacterized protein n=1 Tax=Bacillus phage Moonbeam TaxID=1540091 RepID=A0A0A0RV93_9CAUD|nr:hypothetical protein CPT_Moonbeam170 [Bacillus phage Moonbeam]AIW03568.1 hypothetical protein CPT_Moonbeam170 [Bacillus phage Moonbeam]
MFNSRDNKAEKEKRKKYVIVSGGRRMNFEQITGHQLHDRIEFWRSMRGNYQGNDAKAEKEKSASQTIYELKKQIATLQHHIGVLEAIIRKYDTKASREAIQALGKKGIEKALEMAQDDLATLREVEHKYRYGGCIENKTPPLLEAYISDVEAYIERLTREKYRIILQEEEEMEES